MNLITDVVSGKARVYNLDTGLPIASQSVQGMCRRCAEDFAEQMAEDILTAQDAAEDPNLALASFNREIVMPTTESLHLDRLDYEEGRQLEREQAINRHSPPPDVCQYCWGRCWDERLPSDVPTEHDFEAAGEWHTPCQNCNPDGVAPGELGKGNERGKSD